MATVIDQTTYFRRRQLERKIVEPLYEIEKEKSYETDLEAIFGSNIELRDGAQLIRSLDTYLTNNNEELTLDQYNHINRRLGKQYEWLLTNSIEKGEVSKEKVLEINKKLSAHMWKQYDRITNKNPNLKSNETASDRFARAEDQLRSESSSYSKPVKKKKSWKKRLIKAFSRKGGWVKL